MKMELRSKKWQLLIGTLFLIGRRWTSLAVPIRLPIYHWICFLAADKDRSTSLIEAGGWYTPINSKTEPRVQVTG